MRKLVLCAALAACGSPPAEVIDGYSVSVASIGFNHMVGSTFCPQDLGSDIEVTNDSDVDTLVLTVSADAVSGVDVIDFGEVDDASPTTTGPLELELLPGESFIFLPWFNCAQSVSFNTNIRVTPEDLELEETLVPITADVQ